MVLEQLKKAGIDLVASLPDQWLGDLIAQCEADPAVTHIRLAREDDGIGICAGAWLGGRKSALVCQNSGVLGSVNALGGIAFHHQIPLLVIAAHRGHYDDSQYYQMYKGRICEPVLEAMGLPYWVIDGPEGLPMIADAARQAYLNRLPVVLLLRRRALVGRK
ncbi:MAG TPA: thiamine pyrophosphate-binding protein [Burkholderiales bacterium]|nr:thiamine pyrophosphate-binding protein [Burkholderiales bacterium]